MAPPVKKVCPPLLLDNSFLTPPPTNLDAGVVKVGLAARRVRQQDVLGLQVAVDDPLGLQDPHGAGDLLQEHPDGVLAQRALGCSGQVCRGRSASGRETEKKKKKKSDSSGR